MAGVSPNFFRRPPHDNGLHIHWSAYQHDVGMARAWAQPLYNYGFRWITLLNASPGVYAEFRSKGFEVNVRAYEHEPFPKELRTLHGGVMSQMRKEDARYLKVAWNEWNNTVENVGNQMWSYDLRAMAKKMAELYIPVAVEACMQGLYPGSPTGSPGGSLDDRTIWRYFVEALHDNHYNDAVDVFSNGAHIQFHNYTMGRPNMSPDCDPLNPDTWTLERNWTPAHWGSPGIMADSNYFRKGEQYIEDFKQVFGFRVPALSSEGGTHPTDPFNPVNPIDPRFPRIDRGFIQRNALDAAIFFQTKAPVWLLTDSCYWLGIRGSWPIEHEMFVNDDPHSPNDTWRSIFEYWKPYAAQPRYWYPDEVLGAQSIPLPVGHTPRVEYVDFDPESLRTVGENLIFGVAPRGRAITVTLPGRHIVTRAGDKSDWNRGTLGGWQVDVNARLEGVRVIVEGFEPVFVDVLMGPKTPYIYASPVMTEPTPAPIPVPIPTPIPQPQPALAWANRFAGDVLLADRDLGKPIAPPQTLIGNETQYVTEQRGEHGRLLYFSGNGKTYVSIDPD